MKRLDRGPVVGADALDGLQIADATTIAPFGTAVPYYFNGFAPDSMRSDSDGNVYVAMYSQGRVLAFNPNGIAIGQILLQLMAGHRVWHHMAAPGSPLTH